jgi:hypothetical protein
MSEQRRSPDYVPAGSDLMTKDNFKIGPGTVALNAPVPFPDDLRAAN